jgi:hypothetical protein
MVQCIVRLCATAFILITGSLLGNILGVMTESADEVSVLSQSESLGSIARFSIFFVALVVGIEPRGINIQYHV